jgi:hypothetical protein
VRIAVPKPEGPMKIVKLLSVHIMTGKPVKEMSHSCVICKGRPVIMRAARQMLKICEAVSYIF